MRVIIDLEGVIVDLDRDSDSLRGNSSLRKNISINYSRSSLLRGLIGSTIYRYISISNLLLYLYYISIG